MLNESMVRVINMKNEKSIRQNSGTISPARRTLTSDVVSQLPAGVPALTEHCSPEIARPESMGLGQVIGSSLIPIRSMFTVRPQFAVK